MPTIAFWNLAKQTRLGLLVEMMVGNGIEILAVSEQEFEPADLILGYTNKTRRPLYSLSIGVPSRVQFYATLPDNLFQPVTDDPYYAMTHYQPLVGESLLLVGVHLPSKLHETGEDQATTARRLSDEIKATEARLGHRRTVVIGDFNMDPFESGMVNGDGLHGVMDRRIAARRSRVIKDRHQPFFYNPMWKLMGDNSARALGTYYRGASSFISYFWHTFDQVLLRPSLLEFFQEDRLRIVEAIGTTSLLAPGGVGIKTTVSDHLPLVLTLENPI